MRNKGEHSVLAKWKDRWQPMALLALVIAAFVAAVYLPAVGSLAFPPQKTETSGLEKVSDTAAIPAMCPDTDKEIAAK